MTTMADPETHVTGGVDTHKDVHVAAALDQHGRVLGTERFGAALPYHLLHFRTTATARAVEDVVPLGASTWLIEPPSMATGEQIVHLPDAAFTDLFLFRADDADSLNWTLALTSAGFVLERSCDAADPIYRHDPLAFFRNLRADRPWN